jgi:hypothetical protein
MMKIKAAQNTSHHAMAREDGVRAEEGRETGIGLALGQRPAANKAAPGNNRNHLTTQAFDRGLRRVYDGGVTTLAFR